MGKGCENIGKTHAGWFISGLTMVYGRYNELVNGDYNGL
jgi:hypothetical protein